MTRLSKRDAQQFRMETRRAKTDHSWQIEKSLLLVVSRMQEF